MASVGKYIVLKISALLTANVFPKKTAGYIMVYRDVSQASYRYRIELKRTKYWHNTISHYCSTISALCLVTIYGVAVCLQ